MSVSFIIGLAAIIVIFAIVFIMKKKSSGEENAVPISNPKEIEELKTSFVPTEQKESSDQKKEISSTNEPANLLKKMGA